MGQPFLTKNEENLADLTNQKGSGSSSTQPDKGMVSLLELQDFLEEEFAEDDDTSFKRAFRPLTDGLGLESPTHLEPKKEDVAAGKPTFVRPLPAPGLVRERKNDLASVIEPDSRIEEVQAVAPIQEEKQAPLSAMPRPPELPQPSAVRRLCAVLIDEVFVLTLWLVALVITSNMLSGFSTGFSVKVAQEFSNPLFLRFAALEFGTIWLAYFAICIGLLDMTFGMWVWGIRIFYGQDPDDAVLMRKLMRILWSFFFYAPIAPLFMLMFRRNRRNLLDALSGTNLYQSVP